MADRRHHPFAAEPVECPAQDNVKLPPVGSVEHRRESRALAGVLAAAGVFNVFGDNLMPCGIAPRAKLRKLVLGVLAVILGADARVYGNAAHCPIPAAVLIAASACALSRYSIAWPRSSTRAATTRSGSAIRPRVSTWTNCQSRRFSGQGWPTSRTSLTTPSRVTLDTSAGVIPSPADQNRCAQSRRPIDMTVQGWSTSLFQA